MHRVRKPIFHGCKHYVNHILEQLLISHHFFFLSGTFRKFLLTFSMSTNGSKVLSTETPPPSTVQAVNGIRVLSMGWVILGHTYFFTLGTSSNFYVFICS